MVHDLAACFEGKPRGRCTLLEESVVVTRRPPIPRELLDDHPESLRNADIVAIWEGVDEDGEHWTLLSGVELLLEIEPSSALSGVGSTSVHELSHDAFFVLMRKVSFDRLLA